MHLHVLLFVSKLVHFGYVVGYVALEQWFHDGVLRFCPTSIIPPVFHTPISFMYYTCCIDFDVLLTVHLSIFILVIDQVDAQNLFYSKFISYLYVFRAPCAHRQEVKIVLYSLWYHHTYRCDDTSSHL